MVKKQRYAVLHEEFELKIKRTKKILTGAGIRTPDF